MLEPQTIAQTLSQCVWGHTHFTPALCVAPHIVGEFVQMFVVISFFIFESRKPKTKDEFDVAQVTPTRKPLPI